MYGYGMESSVPPSRSENHMSAVTRREVLTGGAALAGGLLIGIDFGPARAEEPTPAGARMNAFIHIAPDDRVTLTMPAVEMGQGVYTSQAMCLAEELDVALDQVVAAHAPPDQANYGNPAFVVQATGGSTTTSAWFLPLRRAGAAARLMLLEAAAASWRVDPSLLATERGVIALQELLGARCAMVRSPRAPRV